MMFNKAGFFECFACILCTDYHADIYIYIYVVSHAHLRYVSDLIDSV